MAFCLGTFVELLDQILHPDDQHHQYWVLDFEKIPQIHSLFQKASFLKDFLTNSTPASFLKDFLTNSTPAIQARIETFEDLVRDAAENAEDMLESYLKAQVLLNQSSMSSPSGLPKFMIPPPDLSEVVQVFEYATSEIIKIANKGGQSGNISHVPSRSNDLTSKDVVVGVDKCLMELKDRITSLSPTREIIPIVGMGGIDKTTLARKLYNEYSSGKHFDICLWATISQEYDQRRVLLSLLNLDGTTDKKNEELKVNLYKELYSRRYLIVLDDVWSTRVWDDIHIYAPDNNNKSRIILTTRENDVADYVSSRRHEMQLLNKEDSWELFGKFAHAGEKCPDELAEVAQNIVRKCGGLPLALQLIGGFMSRAERIKDVWENVADDISSYIAKEDNQFSAIFSWSYANLPHYLKPCLLYIGAFPEDHAIGPSRLIKLWVAEGFLNPIKNKSPEEVAETYLNALIDRNLIFVRERTFSRRVLYYGIHDLLRDLCLRKAEEKMFIFTKKIGASENGLCKRRVCISSDAYEHICGLELELMTRSFQIIGGYIRKSTLPNIGCWLSLLRVLDVYILLLDRFPEEISKLVKLKYLGLRCRCDCESPSSIAVLQNLQTIVFSIESAHNFLEGLSHLQQLRHLESSFFHIDRAPHSGVPPHPGKLFTLAETLQTLEWVSVAIVAQLIGKLPNLKSLGLHGGKWEGEPNIDLSSFPRLEIIYIWNGEKLNPIFPQTLRELSIYRPSREVSWTSFMSRIGALPNLQLLRLRCFFPENKTWEPTEGEFCNLQYLRLQTSNLENWIADETHFPQLNHLAISSCESLKEIPVEFGGIETLEIIELHGCKASVFDSARSILQEKLDFGNESFQLRLGRMN